MRIAIGLPNTVLDVPGQTFPAWARLAEERGFSSLATIDRLVYPSHDSLTVLAAAASATRTIGLLTNVLLSPLYPPALLAKVAATVDRLSGGRLTLGLGVGRRPDDYEAAGRPFGDRGRRFDRELELLRGIWAGQKSAGDGHPPAPGPVRGRIPILIGGDPHRAAPRAARWGDGYTIGGAPADGAAGMIETFRAGWTAAGRTDEPSIVALQYFSMGAEAEGGSFRNLRTYYGYLGDAAERIATGAARSPEAVRSRIEAFAALGVDELVFVPTAGTIDQVDGLADVALAG